MSDADKMQVLANIISHHLNSDISEPRTGFFLLTFGFHAPGIANYISNADREAIIVALRETANRLESHQDNTR